METVEQRIKRLNTTVKRLRILERTKRKRIIKKQVKILGMHNNRGWF